jgi:rod shape determining protein RodA
MKWRDYFREFEWHLLLIGIVLTSLGIAFIWSSAQASEYLSRKPFHQILFLLTCLPVVTVILWTGYSVFARYAYGLYALLLLLLLLVLAVNRRGAARWFDLPFGFRMQPSEFLKLTLILALSRYLMYPRNLGTWRGWIPPFLMTAVPMALIMEQPDLGTALVLVPVVFGMLYAAGVSARGLLTVILVGLLALPLIYFLPILQGYQLKRVHSFFLPSIPSLDAEATALKRAGKREDARKIETQIQELKKGSGYQQFYAKVAIGSGGVLGNGLARGPQNLMNTLPERHTDFIFAVIGEEWGFLGCSAVLLLFFLMLAIIFGVANRTREPFGRYLCTGVAILFTTQAFINTAISVGLLPITGLTLPFVSYGGSSLLSSYIALAFVLDVGVRRIRVFGPLD